MNIMVTQTKIDYIFDQYNQYAQNHNFLINPSDNYNVAKKIIRKTLEIEEETGIGFCPCKPDLQGKKTKVRRKFIYRSKCPCVDAAKEIAASGHCCCNLFWSETYFERNNYKRFFVINSNENAVKKINTEALLSYANELQEKINRSLNKSKKQKKITTVGDAIRMLGLLGISIKIEISRKN